MDDLDDDVPELVPVLVDQDGGETGEDGKGPVFQAPKRLEKTVPVTLITGFLGAGKSTLVNYILSEHHGFRIAVILNEIGDQRGIEKALLQDEDGATSRVDEWVELTNGCLCCSVKDDFVNALESLMLQQTVFDYILIETTGLANPGPVAAALWTDEELEAGVVLDCIVTVVDAKHIRRQLSSTAPTSPPGHTSPPPQNAHAGPPDPPDAPTPASKSTAADPHGRNAAGTVATEAKAAAAVNEAQQQVAYADVILLNKTDLVSAEELREVRAALLRHNAAADVVECRDSRVDLRKILDRGSYKRAALEAAAVGLPPEDAAEDDAAAGGCMEPGHDGPGASAAPLSHDPGVTTVTLRIEEPVALDGVKAWMDTLLWESAAVLDIFRVKGLLCISGSDRKHGLQAVHELYDVAEGPPWSEGEERCTRIVVIGRHLDHAQLLQSLCSACLPS